MTEGLNQNNMPVYAIINNIKIPRFTEPKGHLCTQKVLHLLWGPVLCHLHTECLLYKNHTNTPSRFHFAEPIGLEWML